MKQRQGLQRIVHRMVGLGHLRMGWEKAPLLSLSRAETMELAATMDGKGALLHSPSGRGGRGESEERGAAGLAKVLIGAERGAESSRQHRKQERKRAPFPSHVTPKRKHPFAICHLFHRCHFPLMTLFPQTSFCVKTQIILSFL